MQINKDDAAFPIFDSEGQHFLKHGGLSKREYFAALALQGILSSPALNPDEYDANLNADLAIEAADILIYRLNKTE
ncbi:MAG: hypothetical protein HEQ27_05260 [Dolichospermum sp. JUN01]|nr:hypothetical protein [Dolichospermum sp. JUN01]